MVKKILVPVDGSEGACRAAAFAVHLAEALGAQITLMYVFDAPGLASLGLVAKGDLEDTKNQVSQGSFEAATRAMGETDVPVNHHVDIGDPARQITTFSKQGQYDLIVMGSRGLSPIKEVLLGSVSERVARWAMCPVTIVR